MQGIQSDGSLVNLRKHTLGALACGAQAVEGMYVLAHVLLVLAAREGRAVHIHTISSYGYHCTMGVELGETRINNYQGTTPSAAHAMLTCYGNVD